MKSKNFTLTIASVLALVLLIGLASATISFTSVPELSQAEGSNSVNISLQSTENEIVSFSGLNSISDNGYTITFSTPSPITVTSNNLTSILVNYNVPLGFDFDLGDSYTTELIATGSTSSAVSRTLTFEESGYCEVGEIGDLEIDVDINNKAGYGESDDEWYFLDTIEVEVEIENEGDEDIDNVIVEWGLYDTNEGKWIIDDEEDDFDVKDGDRETITFTFQVDPDEFDLDSDDYIFYVKAYSDDEGEDNQCISYSENIDIMVDDDFVVLDDLEYPATLSCGMNAQFSGEVWNIGEDDQEDVEVGIFSSELGINEYVDIGDVDSLENEDFNFNFNVPEDVEEGTYSLTITVYDEDGDAFENDGDEESSFKVSIKIAGSCKAEPKAVVAAVLEKGGKAGKDLVIKATVTNTGEESKSFIVNAAGYTEWAQSVSIDPTTVTLNAGESKDIELTFDVKNDVEGDKMFTVEVLSGAELAASQPVSVTIEKGFSFSLPNMGDTWYLWAIGAINVILVIIIIIVAIRVARS